MAIRRCMTCNPLLTSKNYIMKENHIKNIKKWKKDVGIKIVNRQKTLEQGRVAQGWTGIQMDKHKARQAQARDTWG